MKAKSKKQAALLAGAEGFTLNETARLLGTEWGEEAQHVARSILRALKIGEFDPPHGWENLTLEQIFDKNISEEVKIVSGYSLDYLSEDKLTGEPINSQTVFVMFSNEMQVGNKGDIGDRIFVPAKAIIRFCTLRNLRTPAFLLPVEKAKSDAVVLEDEVYQVLAAIGAKDELHIPELADMVSGKLGKQVTSAMSAFKAALKRAREDGIIIVAKVGRPAKSGGIPKTRSN
jgi:hypothetical protein